MTFRERLQLEPKASEVEKLNDWLDTSLLTAGTHKQVAADLKLCINEAVANLISYAFVSTKNAVIVVEITLDAQSAKGVIFDNGSSFQLNTWPELKKPQTIGETKPGGFGLGLIKERARSIDYESTGILNKLTIVCGV